MLRKKRRNKKGFIFSLDAFLAAMLLIGGLVLITQQFSGGAPQEQIAFLSQDTLRAISTIQMAEINDPTIEALIDDGTIDDPQVSVLMQLGKFWATNDTTNAENLSALMLHELLPAGYSVSLDIEGDQLYNNSGMADRNIVAARRMVSGVAKGEALEGSTGVAYLQRISSKRTNAYAYFGGFVGQGDITTRLDNLPSDINSSNIKEILLEGEFDDDFEIYFNGVQCGGTYTGGSDLEITSYNLTSCAGNLSAGNNTVQLLFSELANASISGGFLRVAYATDEFIDPQTYGEKITWLPGIDGVINLYDGLSTPGTLTNLTLYLHYDAQDGDLPLFVDVANITIYESNNTGEINITFTNAYLDAFFDYNSFSNITVPFRLGYYEGNGTNASGNITDVFLITSRHYSMSTEDIYVDPATNISRIDQVKIVDDLFVDILLNASGNRVGLVSFGTGASVDLDNTLTDNPVPLHADIAGYAPHPTDAQRYLCGAVELSKAQLLAAGSGRKRAIMLMTDGDLLKTSGNTARCDGSPTNQRHLVWADLVKQACDSSDPVHGNPQNITFYTVAFGPEAATDIDIQNNLTLMANCTGGRFAYGSNTTDLEDIYREFAEEISASTVVYSFQRITTADNIASTLYNDSHFTATYIPTGSEAGPQEIDITFQTDQFGTCTPTIDIPASMRVVEAELISYSGDYWTKEVIVDGTSVYDLTDYGSDFAMLGDPSRVLIPADLLTSGSHTFDIVLGANASVDEQCSFNDSLIYTALVNTTVERSTVLPSAEGCHWAVEFEDGSYLNVSVPSGYTGSEECSYNSTAIVYDSTDTYHVVVYQLFDSLDFDGDGRVFVNLDEQDLQVTVTIVSSVPYLWGPSIATMVISR